MTAGEYTEACRVAKEALYDVLMATEPDTGGRLRVAYTQLKRLSGTGEAGHGRETREREEREREERLQEHKRRTGWKRISMDRREAFAFQLLGDDRLTIADLTKRFRTEFGTDIAIHETHIRGLVARMLEAGHLARKGEAWQGRVRYRYFRKRELEGPIVELEAMLQAHGDEERAA